VWKRTKRCFRIVSQSATSIDSVVESALATLSSNIVGATIKIDLAQTN